MSKYDPKSTKPSNGICFLRLGLPKSSWIDPTLKGIKMALDTGELSAAFLLEIDCKNETLEELEMTTFDSAGLKGKKTGSFNLKDLEIETLRGWGRKGGADYQFANYACKKFKK